MNKLRTTPTLITLAIVAALAACGRTSDNPPATSSTTTTITTPPATSTPPASSSSSTTMTPPASTTPPSGSTSSSGSSGSSGMGGSSTPDASTPGSTTGSSTPGSTGSSSSSSTGYGTGGGSSSSTGPTSLAEPASGRLAAVSAAALRASYGVDLTLVADSGKLSRGDRSFLKDAAAGGMYEVEAAKIASQHASDPAIKSFADKLVKDHGTANDELKQLASSRNAELPKEPSMLKRRALDSMRKESATNLDRDFINKVGIKDHEADIKMFEKASRDAKDPEIRAWAQKLLPTLREHLATAQNLSTSQGTSGSMGGAGTAPRSSSTSNMGAGTSGSK